VVPEDPQGAEGLGEVIITSLRLHNHDLSYYWHDTANSASLDTTTAMPSAAAPVDVPLISAAEAIAQIKQQLRAESVIYFPNPAIVSHPQVSTIRVATLHFNILPINFLRHISCSTK
jgi:hypothetical protein